jgi:hypothetical protein
MKIIALEQETPDVLPEQFQPYLEDEARYLWDLVQSGVVRETYFRSDRHTAVLILECRDVKDAEMVLSELPLVKQGLISFELLPLIPYSGYSRLFAHR